MIFGYIRESANWSIARQAKVLAKAGVAETKILVDKIRRGTLENRDASINLLRKGDKLAVAGLGRLGTDHMDLRQALDAVFERKATVIDLLFDTEIPPGGLGILESYQKARADWLGERTIHGRRAAKARGLRGGRPKLEFTPEEERKARKVWFNKQIRDNKAAANRITMEKGEPVSTSYLLKRFGGSGRVRNKPEPVEPPKRKR